MNKTVLSILTVAIASLMGGCSFFSNFKDAKQELEDNPAQPIPVKTDTAENSADTPAEETTDKEFADLDKKEQAAKANQAIVGLIPATNSDTRVRNSIRGREDPFSVVTLVPKIEIEPEEEKKEVKPQTRVTNRTNRERLVSNRNSNRTVKNSTPTNQPTAKLAEEVIISGLFESNGGTKLIVQAPEENSSRYVEVGQYLSNGQILVKSVDRNHFPTPMVVLEQSGVEIRKTIGEAPGDSRNKISSLPSGGDRSTTLLSNSSWDSQSIQ